MDKTTIEVLRNFASINQGIIFYTGNVLRTMSTLKNMFGTASVPDVFEREFAIYDLNEFLSTLSLFTAPEISYKDDHILIQSGKSKIKYYYSNPKVIISPPPGKVITINPEMSFKLPAVVLDQLQKAAAVMKLKELEISENGIRVFNKNQTGNQYVVEVEGLEGSTSPKVVKIENLKMLSRDYSVQVDTRAVKFTSIDGGLEYIVAIESE